jgi:hypothetical protein
MSKHKSPDQKLHSQPTEKVKLSKTAIRATNNPSAPPKGTNQNNQFR